jgi:hypothetical protein
MDISLAVFWKELLPEELESLYPVDAVFESPAAQIWLLRGNCFPKFWCFGRTRLARVISNLHGDRAPCSTTDFILKKTKEYAETRVGIIAE